MHDTGLLSIQLWPNTEADRERLAAGVQALLAEDPTLHVRTGRTAGEVVIAGLGDVHLEVALDRLKREFKVEASLGRPQVAYKETLTCPADGEARHAAQLSDRREYAHAKIHLSPADPGAGYTFENRITGGTIPAEFIGAVDEGIREALSLGVLAGYPVDDVRVELYDGSYHGVDSSAVAFRIAGSMAFQDAAKKAKPVLLEPIMRVEVVVPPEQAADVAGDLTSRRGQVLAREDRNARGLLTARVPLAGMFGYSGALRERTRGRGTFVMRFNRYEPLWPDDDDADRGSNVTAPRRPSPTLKSSRAEAPEPDSDGH